MFLFCSIMSFGIVSRGVGAVSVQLSFGWPQAPRWRAERLFFAIQPDVETAAWIERRALRWRDRLSPTGTVIPARRLHITLYGLGDYETLPALLVEQACQAADTVTCRPFDVAFDRCGEFGGGAIVLYGRRGTSVLRDLRRRLGSAMSA